jgi:hypothetical protein
VRGSLAPLVLFPSSGVAVFNALRDGAGVLGSP